MKTFKSVLIFLVALLFLVSCEREQSFENGTVISSSGTLKSSTTGNCLPSTLNGIYKTATALSADNYLDVQVDVAGIGDYIIYSDTVNGFAFKGQGSFSTAGISTVRLSASGTPATAGTNNFTIRYGNSACVISVTIVAANAVNGIYSFVTGTNGDCTGAVLSGVYTVGTAADISNTVRLGVTVTTAGSYNITIPAVNGISFSGSGVFTNTGVQNVTLTASGTPVAAGSFNATASIGTSTCTFSITATAAGGSTIAVFTLGGAGSNCTGVTLAGTYTSGIAMTPANTSRIDVNVTTPGTYTINTDAANGVSFAVSGNFTTTGTQFITLTASGTPVAPGVTTFAVSGGGTTCNFNVTFAAPAAPAVFTLAGAPGACTSPIVNGNYQALTPLTSTNTVTIKVDVTSAGSYSIATNSVNGIMFSASGVFAAAGMGIMVTMAGTGTPLTAGTTTLTTSPGTGCTFDIVIAAAPTGIFNCKIDGVYTSFDDRAAADVFDDFTGVPVPYLYLNGYSGPPNGGFVPQLQIFITKNDNSTVGPGTYDENHWVPPGTYRIEIDLHLENPDQSVTIWNTSSNFLPPPHPPFTIIVTSRTATRIKGTFSGQVTNLLQGSTALKTITAGVFDLPIQ